jgi:hypothetical protein
MIRLPRVGNGGRCPATITFSPRVTTTPHGPGPIPIQVIPRAGETSLATERLDERSDLILETL